jgi:hypothetical protein
MRVLINGKDINELMNSHLTPDKLIAFWGYTQVWESALSNLNWR